jgi:hypothetical protein
MMAAVVVLTGAILALSHHFHQASQQPMFPPGTVIPIPAAPAQPK